MRNFFRLGVFLGCLIIAFSVLASEEHIEEAVEAFYEKICLNPTANNGDPYRDDLFDSTPPAAESVCALQYEPDGIQYILETFESAEAAELAGYVVTHQGQCGTCSTLQDLATYLDHPDLTTPVRECSRWILFPGWTKSCLRDIGFSDECADTWFYNARNTGRECLWVCLQSWLNKEPFNDEDGELNDCLACDEERSGPVFKAAAGRTRRNSGINSAIDREESEVYSIVHDYY
jgi:hypothetical protein